MAVPLGKLFFPAIIDFRRAGEICTDLCDYVVYHHALSAVATGVSRLAEDRADLHAARKSYEWVSHRAPNHFYGLKAAIRLDERGGARFPRRAANRRPEAGAQPPRDIAERLKRSRLLVRLSLSDVADLELITVDPPKSGAYWIGMDLADPRRFRELMFPLPWRGEIVRQASRHALDPHLVAALVRQESEFNPNALSRAGAHGLMQIMPETAARLARSVGKRGRHSTPLLKQPEMNLQLGTLYLRRLIDQFDGGLEAAIAGYNAGPGRVRRWSRESTATSERSVEAFRSQKRASTFPPFCAIGRSTDKFTTFPPLPRWLEISREVIDI